MKTDRFIIRDNYRLNNCLAFITRLPLDKEWSVEIKPFKKQRSDSQNRLYWSWIHCFSDYNGDLPDDLHDHFRKSFLGYKRTKVLGKWRKRLISTTELNVEQFTAYLNRIEMVAREIDLQLPKPDDYKYAYGE